MLIRRKSSIFALDIDNKFGGPRSLKVDVAAGDVIRRAYSEREKRIKDTTNGKSYRILELDTDMRSILQKRVAKVKSENKPLFNTRTWAVKNFSKHCIKAGVREIHFHSLRHTGLTNLANGYGMDRPLPLPQFQKIASYQDISTTMRYVHADGLKYGLKAVVWRTK